MTPEYKDRVREKVDRYPVDQLDLQSLFALIIGPKATPELTGRLASYPLDELSEMSKQELANLGLGMAAGARVAASIQLGKMFLEHKIVRQYKVGNPQQVVNYLAKALQPINQEYFIVLFLDSKSNVIDREILFKGSLNASLVHPREVFKSACKKSSASIIVVHNHPSGSPEPSPEDIVVTTNLKQAGDIIGIELLDHIIVAHGKFKSLKELGYLN